MTQHQKNLKNIVGTFAIEGMTISKATRSNLDRIGSGCGWIVFKVCKEMIF